MNRELRLKVAGMLFYVILTLNLAFSTKGSKFFSGLSCGPGNSGAYQAIAAIVGAGAVLFTSEAIGYLFTSIHVFLWNIIRGGFEKGLGGYSGEWKRLSYDPKLYITELYKDSIDSGQLKQDKEFDKLVGTYNRDVFLSTIWLRAPKEIVDWATRRYTAFFLGMATLLSLFMGLLISIIAIKKLNMDWTTMNDCIFVLVSMFCAIVFCNAQYARNEARQIIDLWLAENLNPQFKAIMKKVTKQEVSTTK